MTGQQFEDASKNLCKTLRFGFKLIAFTMLYTQFRSFGDAFMNASERLERIAS